MIHFTIACMELGQGGGRDAQKRVGWKQSCTYLSVDPYPRFVVALSPTLSLPLTLAPHLSISCAVIRVHVFGHRAARVCVCRG